jgi:hypothetical protein
VRSASICLGVVDYVSDHYRKSDRALRFAVSDATAFFNYTKAISDAPNDSATNHLIINAAATYDKLEQAVASIETLGNLELFILYLSGHGEVDDHALGWFCLVDAEPGVPSLGREKLRALLDKISSQYVVVLIDCCYAEAIATGIGLPINLRERKGRLIIASARANQQSWEDSALQRSIFSDVVLRSLSVGSPIADLSGAVDVEARLVPYLREQVPLEAATRKGGRAQEPVSGGWMAQPLKLPTVETQSLGRPLTTLETVRAGIRRALLGVVFAFAISLLLVDALVFHLSVGTTGRVLVRPGLSLTFDLMPFHFSSSVDTGISISDFDPSQNEIFDQLANAGIRGFQTHLDEHGLKTWFAKVTPSLQSTFQKTLSAMVLGKSVEFRPDNEPAPIEETLFLATIENKSVADIAASMYLYDRQVNIQCYDPVKPTMDFNILNVSTDVFRNDALWLALTAPKEPEGYAKRAAEIVRLAAYRAAHEENNDSRVSEFAAFAEAIEALGKTSMPTEGVRSRISATFAGDQSTWCGIYSAFARAILGEEKDSQAAEDEFRQLLVPPNSEPGAVPGPSELMASEALGRIAIFRPLGGSTLETLMTLDERDHDLDSTTPSHSLLDKVALLQPLSDGLVDYLFEILRAPHEQFDFNYIVAIRVLASNTPFLTQKQQDEVSDWLKLHSEENRTMSDVNEALGFVSAVRPLTEDEISLLEARLPLVSLFALPGSNYRGDLVIGADTEKAAVALGRVAQSAMLSQDTLKKLDNLAYTRKTLKGREEILRGLAANWYKPVTDVAETMIDRIQGTEASEDRREFETDVAVARLRTLATDDRQAALRTIARRWREETRPELRVALAKLISSAVFPLGRVRESKSDAD